MWRSSLNWFTPTSPCQTLEERAGKRINETRIRQVLETGSEVLATVCPLCLTQLDSAVKVLDMDDRIRVRDILELVGERI